MWVQGPLQEEQVILTTDPAPSLPLCFSRTAEDMYTALRL